MVQAKLLNISQHNGKQRSAGPTKSWNSMIVHIQNMQFVSSPKIIWLQAGSITT